MKKESDNQELSSHDVDPSNDIPVIEQKISELEIRYKWKRQMLEQQMSILVTKDMLNASSKTSTCNPG